MTLLDIFLFTLLFSTGMSIFFLIALTYKTLTNERS